MISIFKGLQDENRLRIFHLITKQQLCVCEIETILELSQSNASRHLAKLKEAGLIEGEKDGQWIHYKVSDAFMGEHQLLLRYLLEQFNRTSLFLKDQKRLDTYLNGPYTCQMITKDKTVVLDYIEENLEGKVE